MFVVDFCVQLAFALWQVELSPTTNRLHVQACLRYSTPVAFSSVREAFNPAHVELSIASEAENIAYCSKEETRVFGPCEWGSRAQQGKRSDLTVVRELVSQGVSMEEMCMDEGVRSYQGLRGAQILYTFCERPRDFVPEVRWYFGETGGGKTRAVVTEFSGERVWWSQKNLQWWEGYDAHPVVCFDDFRKDFCTFHELLRIFDSTPYRVMVKGGSRQLLARIMIVTCPWDVDVLYASRSSEDVGQLLRRVTVRKQFGDVVPAPVASTTTSVSVSHFRNT